VQWMTAGSGLIHSELPEQQEGLMEGFQLWLNLPADQKMIKPSYRDIASQEIPEIVTDQGVRVRVIAGHSRGTAGAVTRPATEPVFLDIHLPAGSQFTEPLPIGHHAFIYTYRGQATVAGQSVPDRHMGILSDQGEVIELSASEPTRVLLIAGKPLNEPIAQYGPFVMNTADQIEQTLRDYRAGQFEAAVVQSL